jgi:hypothetical protein
MLPPSPLTDPDAPISGIRFVWGFLCQGSFLFLLPLRLRRKGVFPLRRRRKGGTTVKGRVQHGYPLMDGHSGILPTMGVKRC